jgi:hypothetical protein
MRLLAVLCLTTSLAAQVPSLDSLTVLQAGRSRRVSSAAKDRDSNGDNVRIAPGATRAIAELTGPGMIRHIWLTFPEARPSWLAKDGGAAPDEIVLRIYWDGAEAPAVEVPVGDFFGVGFGRRRQVRSLAVQVEEGDSYNCWWPMPFGKSARLTLSNESDKPLNSTYFHVDWEEKELPARTPYFCAQYRQDFPAKAGEHYLILDAEGEGHYVGTVLSVRTRSPQWFGEGDERFYVDGEAEASIQGTGTEDYFLSAWGLQAHSFPYAGTPLCDGPWGHIGLRLSSYRWHLLDPVRFRNSLRVTIEHRGWVDGDEKPDGKVHGNTERFDDFASVAFWYQLGQPKRFATLPSAAERKPPNLDVVVEGKALLEAARSSGGELSLQEGWDWTGDGQVFYRAPAPDAWVEVDFTVDKEDYRALVLPLTRSYDYGVWRVSLDGKQVLARLDLWSEDTRVEEISLGSFKLTPGKHTLRFDCLGKSPRSTACYLGLDSVRLRQRLAPR